MRYFDNFQELYAHLRNKAEVKELPEAKKAKKQEVSMDMPKDELMKIAESKGITMPKKATKQAIIDAIKEQK